MFQAFPFFEQEKLLFSCKRNYCFLLGMIFRKILSKKSLCNILKTISLCLALQNGVFHSKTILAYQWTDCALQRT